MSPAEQRIAIAEACGWTRIIVNWQGALGGSPKGFAGLGGGVVPDYLTDLNAMHEAENLLLHMSDGEEKPDAWDRYMALLPSGFIGHWAADQRAEAFLRTIGKWHDLTPEELSVEEHRKQIGDPRL